MAGYDHRSIAEELHEAELKAQAVSRITGRIPGFTLAEGYETQALLAELHRNRGERIVGRKMGMTSRPKMLQMGVNSPIHGFLTDVMEVSDGGELDLANRIHAKVEPEIAFFMGKKLSGQPSLAEAMGAVDCVVAALEIIDSRFQNFDFQLPDVVADNCSSSAFVLGGVRCRPGNIDLANLGITLETNGRPQQFGSSAAILGHPGRSLVELVKMLDAEDKVLSPGDLVLAGAATAAIPLERGSRVRGVFGGLGKVEMRVKA
jgi:2-oxo-3-hexenedioate decarboxylase